MNPIEILQKPSTSRTPFELNFLFSSLKTIAFFSNLLQEKGEETLSECLKVLTHESFEAGSIVFQIGSFGSKFYVLLQGKAFVETSPDFSPRQFHLNFEENTKLKNSKNNEILSKNAKEKHSNSLKNSKNAEVFFPTEIPLNSEENTVKTSHKFLLPGNSFGELALLTGKPRAATVVCLEACEFAVLDKRFFNKIMNSSQIRELEEKLEFLQKIPFFKPIQQRRLNHLVFYLKKLTFYKGNFLYKEGDLANGFFIVKNGLLRVSKNSEIGRKPSNLLTGKLQNYSSHFLAGKFRRNSHFLAIFGEKEVAGFEEICE